MKEENEKQRSEEKGKGLGRKLLRLLLNWHLWLSVGLAWIITNGWSYIMLGIGTFCEIPWMVAVAGAYLTFLWFPFTPEKLVTAVIAILLHKLLFPRDEETLALLHELYQRAKAKWKARRKRRQDKEVD